MPFTTGPSFPSALLERQLEVATLGTPRERAGAPERNTGQVAVAVLVVGAEERRNLRRPSGDALDGAWTASLPKDRSTSIVVMEGVLEYFTKEQTATCLYMLCDSFEHGYLVAEMNSMFMVKHSKQHDAIKNSNTTFKWGTDSGTEFVELEPRLTLLSERSYNEEMRKHTLRGKLFAATFGKNINNRIAVFRW